MWTQTNVGNRDTQGGEHLPPLCFITWGQRKNSRLLSGSDVWCQFPMMIGCMQDCWISGATFLAKMSQLHHQKAFRLSPKVWYIVWGWLLQVDQWDRWFDWESNLRNEGATGFVDHPMVQFNSRSWYVMNVFRFAYRTPYAVVLILWMVAGWWCCRATAWIGALKWKDDRPGKSCCEWWHNWSLFPAPAARPQGYEIQLRGALQLSPKVVLRRWTQLYVMVMSSGCEG